MKNLDVNEFKEQISTNPKAIIIDVRTPEEENEGIIENSINMNIMSPDFSSKVNNLENDKEYYVFCRSGGRSANACQYFDQLGLTSYNLLGGIQAWNQYNSK